MSCNLLSMPAGPSSRNRPVKELHPGPPFNQRTTGSFPGSFRDSKNPMEDQLEIQYEYEGTHTVEKMLVVLVIIQIARYLLDARINA